jgi:hypothetical protein
MFAKIFRFLLPSAALTLSAVVAPMAAPGCDSAPATAPAADRPAPEAPPVAKPRLLTARPVDRSATASAPAAASAAPATATASAPATPARAPTRSRSVAASPAPDAPDAPAAPARRTATDAERAAAARMSAESAARRRAAAQARSEQAVDEGSATAKVWSVFLASFTGDDHPADAAATRDLIARRYPALADAFVNSGPRGSMVLVGRFDGPKDPQAQARLKAVKELADGAGRAFPRAMLTRTATDVDPGPPGPNDLRTVRQRFPKAALYSLQVAVWSAFDSKELRYADLKRAAEAYCRELRMRGEEAYYFHDAYSRTSTVMVGVYGPDAYDPKSTLYSPEVQAAMKRFPKHLVNGEELLVPIDPRKPEGAAVPQPPRLVEIPRM